MILTHCKNERKLVEKKILNLNLKEEYPSRRLKLRQEHQVRKDVIQKEGTEERQKL
jgi:hypothetical protein